MNQSFLFTENEKLMFSKLNSTTYTPIFFCTYFLTKPFLFLGYIWVFSWKLLETKIKMYNCRTKTGTTKKKWLKHKKTTSVKTREYACF